MHLGEMEAKNFYHIWLGLLEFTNQKHNIAPALKKMRGAKVLNPQQLIIFTLAQASGENPREKDRISSIA